MSTTVTSRSPPNDPTREIAFDVLDAVIVRRRGLDGALDRFAAGAEQRDRAAAHRLAATVLRRQGTLEAVIEPLLTRAPPQPVQLLLLLGAAQLLLLDTPPHAAVATSVALARRRRLEPFTGLVNAVLRRVAAGGPGLLAGLDGERLDIPPWLWSSWGDRARAIAAGSLAGEAPIDLSLRPGAEPPSGSLELPTGTVRLPAGTRVADLPGYEAGAFWVQDAAAALPARLLGVRPGERVADLCAAPGGKTAQLVLAGAEVIAVDRDSARLPVLRQNLARLRLQAEIVCADATSWTPAVPLDAVLLDAPCSATGTIRRHPDILRTRRPPDPAEAAVLQARLLRAAAGMLRPGGRLVYAVCSLQEEEGAAHLAQAAALGLRPDPFRPEELAQLPEARSPDGWLRTDPGLWPEWGGMDGFFAARLLKL